MARHLRNYFENMAIYSCDVRMGVHWVDPLEREPVWWTVEGSVPTCESERMSIAVVQLINDFVLRIFHLNSTLYFYTYIAIAMWFRTHTTITKIEYDICHSNYLIAIFAFDPLQLYKATYLISRVACLCTYTLCVLFASRVQCNLVSIDTGSYLCIIHASTHQLWPIYFLLTM